jgi:fructose-1,6-bisphosphatase II
MAMLGLLDASQAAAAACIPWVGRGDKHAADGAAVDAMRAALARLPGRARVVIGEGEKDAAPMLYAGEELGDGAGPLLDLAIDPLEGTNLCASGAPGAITVIGAAPRGTLRPLSGFYMDKLVAGGAAGEALDLDRPIEENVRALAAALGKAVSDVRAVVLRRPRHDELIGRIRGAGAQVTEISDGDVMAAIAALVPGGGVDLAAGIGGAPEAVVTACAVRALGGTMQGRLAPQGHEERDRVVEAGELDRRFDATDLAAGDDTLFVATAVTGSSSFPGPVVGHGGVELHSLVASGEHGLLRITATVALDGGHR